MKVKTLLLLGITFLSFQLQSQDYNCSNIPAELKKNVYAVVRKDIIQAEIKEWNNLEIRQHCAFTVFNKSGDFLSRITEYYDDNKTIQSITVNIYDEKGKKIKTVKKNKFEDYSATSGFSLYEDTRVLTYRPVISTYPYTIEYIILTKEKDFISLPDWTPVIYDHVGIESSTYELIAPKDYEIKFRFLNTEKTFTIKEEGINKRYTVSLENFPAFETEPFQPDWKEIMPIAFIVPENFQQEEYKGSFTSWKDFSKWKQQLREGRIQLSDEVMNEVRTLVSDIEDPRKKIKILYKYLQNSTRYVNISYGIGGYQPFPAMTVYENGYGDCKALTNYMYALLNCVGIKSWYANVYAGNPASKILRDFPSQQFNHVILCVPIEQDTIWLECTSQVLPAGYLGNFTEDRMALLVDDSEGKLVKTRSYKAEDNLLIRKGIVTIDSGFEHINAKISTLYEGQQYENVENYLHESAEDQRKKLLQNIDIPQFKINSFEITMDENDFDPVGRISLDLDLQNYAIPSGERYFLPVNLMNKRNSAPRGNRERKHDIRISYSYHDIDSISYVIPENYEIEFLPEKVLLKNVFAEYSMECQKADGNLLLIRNCKFFKGTYPKELYSEFAEFQKAILKADKSKALLRLKSTN